MDHFFGKIQGWFDYRDVYNLILRSLPRDFVFVELGVWKGKSLSYFAVEAANRNKFGRIIAVDHWLGSAEQQGMVVSPQHLFESFLGNIEPVRDRIEVLRKESKEAAKGFPDASLDAIFIDGSHDYLSVRGDIEAWWPKMKGRCVFSGHDFHTHGVNRAVREFSSSIGLEPSLSNNSWWFEVGR